MRQKEKITDTRSETKAKRFRLYKLIALSVLVVFLLGGLILFKNDITVENLRYLIKYLDFTAGGAFSEEAVIHYNADSANDFHVFRGDLVVTNESGVTLFDRRGSAVLTDSFRMANPTCAAGDKYLIVYDLGGHQLRVYNSFSLLFEKTFDYIIQSVSVNSDGAFCVVSSEKAYHSAVFVYDQNFREIHQWFSTGKFAVEASLSDRNVLTISAIRAEQGNLIADLIELKIGKEGVVSTCTFEDEMPLSHNTDRKGTLLLTDESLKYVEKGEVVRSTLFPEEGIEMVSYGEKLCAVLQDELSVGVNFRLRIFDREGNEILSQKFSDQIRNIRVWEDTVFVLTHTSLFEIENGKEMKEHALNGDYSDFGVFSRNTVILCSESKADICFLE